MTKKDKTVQQTTWLFICFVIMFFKRDGNIDALFIFGYVMLFFTLFRFLQSHS